MHAPGLHRGLDGLHVLVIEDDDDTREVLSLGLTLYGAEVVPVASAAEAMAALERGRPDVILSDIGLPDQDGLELMRHLRQLPPARGGRVPAVGLTAFTLCDDVETAARAGFQCHFRKPVETGTLFETLARLGRGGDVERRQEIRRVREAPISGDRRTQDRRAGAAG